jgi:hypothetical protein
LIEQAYSYLSRALDKQDKVKQLMTYDPESYLHSTAVPYFPKVQVKKDLKPNSYVRFNGVETKAGQSVCPVAKGLNHLASAVVRLAEKTILENLDPKIYLHFGKSRDNLRDFVRRNYNPEHLFVSTDYVEFDTFHETVSNDLMCKIFEYLGIDSAVIKILNKNNDNWCMDGNNFKIFIKNHLQSGRPDTLFKNTIFNMCIIMTYLGFNSFSMALFCGDDASVSCDQITAQNFPKCMDSRIKIDIGPIGSFVGFVLKDDLYLDVPRIVVGLCNKSFKFLTPYLQDQLDTIREYQLGVKDYFRLFPTMENLYQNVLLISAMYNMSEGESQMLIDFMSSYALCDPIDIHQLLNTTITEPRILLPQSDLDQYKKDIFGSK